MPLDVLELNQYEKLVRKEFGGGFKGQQTSYQLFTSEITDTESLTIWEFLGGFPRVREWVGARHVNEFENYDYAIRSKDWELTIKIPYKKLLDASRTALSSLTRERSMQLGAQFRRDYPAEKIIEAIEAGTTALAYDGIAFFATSSRDWDNLLTGTGVTLATVKADLASARAKMKKFTDDEGRVLNITGDVALIPPELEEVFMELTKATVIDSTTNVGYGSLKFVVDGRLSDANDWYLFASNEFVKPIVCVNVGDVNVALKDTTFEDKSVVLGADCTGNIGYSFPQLACKIVNT